ncbi:MAG: glutathione S-transferase N-terminal domain-containing protein [Deltaproteobacteria bacterium]
MAQTSLDRPIRLHRFAPSGHCHRVELLLSLLELPFEIVDVNLGAKEHKTARFLALNPFGQVPVIEDGELTLADSNAILIYLAAQYGGARWAPSSPLLAAEQQRWFSIAAGPLAHGPAAARAHRLFGSPLDLPAAQARAHALFALMNRHLTERAFLLGSELGLADVANYAYVARAPEGGVELDEYPLLRAWLGRIEATPGFVGIPESPRSAA